MIIIKGLFPVRMGMGIMCEYVQVWVWWVGVIYCQKVKSLSSYQFIKDAAIKENSL